MGSNSNLAFIFIHGILLSYRMYRINSYGPCALLFLAFFDFFFAVPIYFDYFVGPPQYNYFEGLTVATESEATQAIYNIVILTLLAIFTRFFVQASNYKQIRAHLDLGKTMYGLLLAIAYAPILYVALAGKLFIYGNYGAILTSQELGDGAFQGGVTALVSVSIIACSLVILSTSNSRAKYRFQVATIFFAMTADVWLQGKRSTVAFFLLIAGLKILNNNRYKLQWRHFVFALACVITMFTFSMAYQTSLRPNTVANADATYTNFRVDMGRDHDVKLAIYKEITPASLPILEYRMQSFLFNAVFFVPRINWPDKPWPFAIYVTSAAFGVDVKDYGWGLTTDIISEFIANIGFYGLIPCAIFFIWSVKTIDRSSDPIVYLMGTLAICSLLVVQISAVSVWHLSLLTYLIYRSVFGSPVKLLAN